MRDLIVVACHGSEWVDQCRKSLETHAPLADVMYVQTQGRWPTGALLDVYRSSAFAADFDGFLLMQDSMTALADPLPWFRDQWQGSGAVAWQLFPMQWDSPQQQELVEARYTSRPASGICGPVFYTDRTSLDRLRDSDLLPDVPTSRMESCASERAWAYAFEQAGMPVVGPMWNQPSHESGVGPFRKVWANRP